MNPSNLRCEYSFDPIGIESEQPRLSWLLESARDGERQLAFQIKVYGDPDSIGKKTEVICWDSGRVESGRTHLIAYAGQPLRSRQRCWWQVRVWNEAGEVSDWSDLAIFEMGLLDRVDWRAKWISLPPPVDRNLEGWTVYLRREFDLRSTPTLGRIYLTARGLYRAFINGTRVGDHALSPDWSDYHARSYYQTFDVTDLLEAGRNAIGVVLSGGWYAGSIGFFGQRFHYGRLPWFLGQLEVDCGDGVVSRSVTDESWVASAGPIVSSDLMQGEDYEVALEMPGWDRAGFEADGWCPVSIEKLDRVDLRVSPTPPLRATLEIPATSVQKRPNGWLVDFGQNMSGWVRMTLRGTPGTPIRFRHGEVLDTEGGLYTENLRSATQGGSIQVNETKQIAHESSFSLNGFRYLEVTGLATDPSPDDFTARAVHSDLPLTGLFECSDAELNQVWGNTVWGQRGNYVSVPTDCPQRDERLGWTGDAQLFAPLGAYNMECVGFFRKFLVDLADGQSIEGGIPEVGPRISTFLDAAPAWGDAFIILPWLLYQMYGDAEPMAMHYSAMDRWMGYIERANPDGIRRNRLNGNYGDWVSLGSETDKVLIATIYWAECARLMEKMARVLGCSVDAQRYADKAERVVEAFSSEYIRGDRLTSDTQTAYVLTLRFGLVSGAKQEAFQERLIELLAENGGRLNTGILGSAHLPEVLARAGRMDLAYRLFNCKDCPSLRFMARSGATTIWERWDAWKPDAGFQNPGMNSFNHVALGSMGVWLYRWVAGIQVDEGHPGFSRFRLAPRPGGGLDWAEATYDSVRGRIRSRWDREGKRLRFVFDLPPNTEALIDLPGSEDSAFETEMVIGGGRHEFERTLS
jgi:alpha-L-rhamnosidase